MPSLRTRRRCLLAAVAALTLSSPSHADTLFTAINPATNHTYYLLAGPAAGGYPDISWTSAEAQAVALGAHLVTINDAAENAWVHRTFTPRHEFLWIGLNDAATEGTFVWSSGQPVTYTNFAPGEPNNGAGNENYVWMWPTGLWNDNAPEALTYGVAESTAPAFTKLTWNTAAGLFSAPSSWSPAIAPSAAAGTFFATPATYTVSFSAPAPTLLTAIEGGNVTFNLASQTHSPQTLYVTDAASQTATLNLSSGTVATTLTEIAFADASTATVNLDATATLSASSALYVGHFGTGALNVAGGTVTTSSTDVATQSTGTLNLSAGAHFTASSLTAGRYDGASASLSAAASTFSISGQTYLGFEGNASLALASSSHFSTGALCVAFNPTSTASATIDGPGTTVTVTNLTEIGRLGHGSVSVTNGATFTTGQLVISNIDFGQGAVSVSGTGSQLNVTNGVLSVGTAGSGSLSLSAGTVASVTSGDIVIGEYQNAAGALDISHATLSLPDNTLIVASNGFGSLSASDGATIHARALTLAGQTGSFGTVSMSGPTSTLNIDGETVIADNGIATLTLAAGAHADSDSVVFIGRQPDSAGTLTIDGANSRWITSNTFVVGDNGSGALVVTNGGQAVTPSELVVSNSPTASGAVTVDGPASLLSTGAWLGIARNGDGSLTISNGGTVTYANAFVLGVSPSTHGAFHLSGPGSALTASNDADAVIGDQGTGTALVDNGATWNITRDLNINNGSLTISDTASVHATGNSLLRTATLTLAGGSLTTSIFNPIDYAGTVTGHGVVAARCFGQLNHVAVSGGTLTLGDPAATDGVSLDSQNGWTIASNATLELLDRDPADLWGHFAITNGALIARNGVYFNTEAPTGFGIFVGTTTASIVSPTGTVHYTADLDIGASPARIYSASAATLAGHTTLAGGTLYSPRGLVIPSTLSGYGTIAANTQLQNGILAADDGHSITVAGSLTGYGVTVGNVPAAIASPTGVVDLADPLDIGSRTANIHSSASATLALVSLSGGTINAAQPIIIPANGMMFGNGTINNSIDLHGGIVHAFGGTLFATGTLSGFGLYSDGFVTFGSARYATAQFVVSSPVTLPPATFHTLSAGPTLVTSSLYLYQSTLNAPTGLTIQPAGDLSGEGTLDANVINNGSIVPSGNGFTFSRSLTGPGTLSGSSISFSSTGSFTGAGQLAADITGAAGSTITATGPLTLGRSPTVTTIALAGTLDVSNQPVTLAATSPVTLSGATRITGGTLVSNTAINLSGSIQGHGVISAPALNHTGLSTFSGVTDLFAATTIAPSSKITVTGGGPATFYLPTTLNGEIHISNESIAVFVQPVTGAGQFTGTGTAIFESGSTILARPATISAKIMPAASLTLAAIDADSLDVQGSARILAPSTLASLSVAAGATLDLTSASLTIADDASASSSASIRSLLAGAYHHGAWNLAGITSSSAASDPDHVTTLGLFDAPTATFIRCTYVGDVTCDGIVNQLDFLAISPTGTTWQTGDFNYDGHVSADDYALFNLGLAISRSRGPLAVPEPAILSLIVPLLLLRRRSSAPATR